MTTTMRFPRFGAAFLTFLLFIASCIASQEFITTLSGRQVPTELVQERFAKQVSLFDHARILYELKDNVLRGADVYLDLRSDVLPTNARRTSTSATVVLNGVSRERSSGALRTVRVKSYSVIIDNADNEVQAITGNGVVLTPLHRSKFPGIFVNKLALSKRPVDLESDLKILGRQPGLHVSAENSRTVIDLATRQAGGSCASGTTHYLEIAVAYDNTFCALYDDKENVATEALQEVVDEANESYASNTCVQLALVQVEAHCNDNNDPYDGYSRLSPDGILNSFQQFWIDSRGNVKRDAAYLITGFQDGTSVAGIAYISAACSTSNGYGWIEGPSAIIFAHEVGHTLGGQHTSSGIMGAVATGGTLPTFSATSVQQFTNYVDNAGSVCMETSRPAGSPPGTSPPATTTTEVPGPVATPEPPVSAPDVPVATPEPPVVPEVPVATPEPPISIPESPVSTPEPVPNQPPVGSAEKCMSGFTKGRALSCRARRLRLITFSNGSSAVGRFRTSLQQRNGQFIVRYRVSDDLYIAKYREFVTTDQRLLGSREGQGEYKTPTGMVKEVESAWDAGEMPAPGGESCCGKDLYVAADVAVCIKSESGMQLCQTISETYNTVIGCTDTCRGNRGGSFTAMSSDQECPSCT